MIRLIFLLLLLARPAAADTLSLINDYTWSISDRRFGGLSGIHMSDNGNSILAISDRGLFVVGTVLRDGDTISGVSNVGFAPVRQISGEPVNAANYDSEGLAVDRRGNIYVSFEGFDRVRKFSSVTAPAEDIPRPRGFAALQDNSGLEALAIDGAGTLYAVPERSGRLDRTFPVFRFKAGRWDQRFSIPRRGNLLPTGAEFGPDGRFYLLERDLAGLLGFKTRIRRFSLGPNGFTDEETLLESRFGQFDNLEGISVWRDDRNRIRITLVSDDNFFLFQKTQLVEFVITDP